MNHKTISTLAKTMVPLIAEPVKKLRDEHDERIEQLSLCVAASVDANYKSTSEVVILSRRIDELIQQRTDEVSVLILRINELEKQNEVLAEQIKGATPTHQIAERLTEFERRQNVLLDHGQEWVDRIAVLEQRAPVSGPQGEPGKDGAAGKDADPHEIADFILPHVKRFLLSNESFRGEKGESGRDGIDGKDGAPGLDGKDGLDGQDGAPGLDGTAGLMGPEGPAGNEGEPGRDGRDGQQGVPGRDGAPGINGRDGLDGVDGLGFDDLVMEYDGEREIMFRMTRGEQSKEFKFTLPIPMDRGIWKFGKQYQRGDVVSFGSSFWIAQCDTTAKPEINSDWRLGVKRGRDGKDGKQGERGLPGKDSK